MLDEVQVAGKQHLGCFVDAHDGKTEPSFLRPLIRTLTDANNLVVVASGTGFSFKDFKYWSRSGVGKEIPWKVIYSTGDFMKQEMQSSYITRYLPPSFLSSHSGEVLESRVYKWLRGRHRFTARFLEELLQGLWEQKGPAAPHKLLNVYVDQLSNFTPLDCKSTLLEQEPDVAPTRSMNFSGTGLREIRTYWAVSQNPYTSILPEEPTLNGRTNLLDGKKHGLNDGENTESWSRSDLLDSQKRTT